MPRNEEFDWIFDYALQFLESDKFDCSIMDFVDEKCFVFEDCEENKLVYTDIHREFCEHVEALINSNLGELGITPEMFVESCERGRAGRDINATVFERLVAMDDFATFKKLMTKRNLELQLEAMQQSLAVSAKNKPSSSPIKSKAVSQTPRRAESKRSDNEEDGQYEDTKSAFGDDDEFCRDTFDAETAFLEALMDPDALQSLKDAQLRALSLDDAELAEAQLQELLLQSLCEMEILHRQEELEHAEIERALLLSLAAEEERLRALFAETERLDAATAEDEDKRAASVSVSVSLAADEKAVAAEAKDDKENRGEDKGEKNSKDDKISVSAAEPVAQTTSPAKKKIVAPTTASSLSRAQLDALSDIKPLSLRPLRAALPLPSAGGAAPGAQVEELASALEDKRRATNEALRLSQQQLDAQKQREETLRRAVNDVDPQDAERRAQHMREQRELLLAKKKAERERKVAAEDQRKARAMEDAKSTESNAAAAALALSASPQKASREEEESKNEDEMKRAMLRAALAQRLKMDLLDEPGAKATTATQNPLRALDRLREDNQRREHILHQHVQKQQQLRDKL